MATGVVELNPLSIAEQILQHATRRRFSGVRLSGPPGSGKTALAKIISEPTGWPRYSVGIIFRGLYESADKARFPTFQAYWASTTIEENLEADRLALKKTEEYLNSGQGVVFDSRFHYAVLKFPLLGVFVDAPLEVRALRQFQTTLSLEELRKKMDYLDTREKDECEKAKELGKRFGMQDFSYRTCPYNLHLRSDLLTLEQELTGVLDSLNMLKN